MSRDGIFKAIKATLGDGTTETEERRKAVEKRLTHPQRSLQPAHCNVDNKALQKLFQTKLIATGVDLISVVSREEIPTAIADYLRSKNLPMDVRHGSDPLFASLPWDKQPALSVKRGTAKPDDAIGLTHALAGVAETGTLTLASGEENPVTLNLLPETLIVALDRANIVAAYEDAITSVRARTPNRQLPRTINFITGPSRTADIAGKIVVGAHGARRVCVVLYEESGP